MDSKALATEAENKQLEKIETKRVDSIFSARIKYDGTVFHIIFFSVDRRGALEEVK